MYAHIVTSTKDVRQGVCHKIRHLVPLKKVGGHEHKVTLPVFFCCFFLGGGGFQAKFNI